MVTKGTVVLGASVLVLLGALFFAYSHQKKENVNEVGESVEIERVSVAIGRAVVQAEVARTLTERARGLSGRPSLNRGEGLLFVFPTAGTHGFWMKEMNFPIDIIWLDKDLTVVHIKENALPESYPESYAPEVPALYVLEVPAGYAQEEGIGLGTQASISNTQ